jgi:hypothetical protein
MLAHFLRAFIGLHKQQGKGILLVFQNRPQPALRPATMPVDGCFYGDGMQSGTAF